MANEKIEGDVNNGRPDSGNPVKQGGVARTTNPTAVEDGDRVGSFYDDVGRQVMVLHQVRDLMATAVAEITTGTKTELIAGSAGVFRDLVEISFANQSSVAATIELYDESTLVKTIEVPANDTVQLRFPVPHPQSATGVAWYVDMEDITGTTVDVEALFANNV